MIVVINNTPGTVSVKIRAILGRYLWRISRDVWVWPKSSIRYDLIRAVEELKPKISIILIWNEKRTYLRFNFKIFGELKERQGNLGLFNHKIKRNCI